MSKTDLKLAMDSLQVKKPFKLSALQPQFKAPVSPDSLVVQETHVDPKTLVSTKPEVHSDTQAPVPTQVSASTQDSSVTMEANTAPKLHMGYTKLPNSILMRLIAGDLIRSEIQILLLIARFTISFQRRFAPLSKAVLERQTGLGGPAVLHAISSLISKGIIEKIPGDQHRPNQLGLIFKDEWEFFSTADSTSQVSQPTPVSPSTQDSRGYNAEVCRPTPEEVCRETSNKDNKTNTNNHSLSSLPETLQKYFSELKPVKKRISEWESFQILQQEYSNRDIADCCEFVLKNGVGIGDHQQICHSPMAFLAKAMNTILPEIQNHRQKQEHRITREQWNTEIQRQQSDQDERDSTEWKKRENAFIDKYKDPEVQHQILRDLLQNSPLRPNTRAGWIFGINKWWDQITHLA